MRNCLARPWLAEAALPVRHGPICSLASVVATGLILRLERVHRFGGSPILSKTAVGLDLASTAENDPKRTFELLLKGQQ